MGFPFPGCYQGVPIYSLLLLLQADNFIVVSDGRIESRSADGLQAVASILLLELGT